MNTNHNDESNGNDTHYKLSLLTFFVFVIFLLNSCATQNAQTVENPNAQKADEIRANNDQIGCQASASNSEASSPLEWQGGELSKAVGELKLTKVKELLRENPPLNEKDNYGNTPLMRAVRTPILESKAVPGTIDTQMMARRRREAPLRIAITRELLKHGADANIRGWFGRTPLMDAIFGSVNYTNQNIKILKLLIQHNADVNLQDESGETALIKAVRNGSVNLVKLLLAHKADLNTMNCNGETALSIAESRNNREIVRLLKQQ